MSESLGTAVLELVADETQLDRTLSNVERSTSQRMSALGGSLTKTLTPVAGTIAALGAVAFKEWDSGFDAIRAGTGATGKELEELGGVMNKVGGQVTAPLSEIGQTVADLNTRLGITGKPLEKLTKQFAELGHLGVEASVENVTRLFGDWGVATEKQADTMDMLFRASQATGPSIDTISRLLVQFGAPLRQMGFDFEESAVLLGKFEKEGVNTELVMGSLRIALGKMSTAAAKVPKFQAKVVEAQDKLNKVIEKYGRESPQAVAASNRLANAQSDLAFAQKSADIPGGFRAMVDEIQKAGTAAEANAMAIKLFGARAGPDMAAAIREGRFEIGALFDQVQNGEDTIEKAAADTLDWGDKLAMLKNRVFAAVGPYGEFVAAIGGGLAAIGPTLLGLGTMAPLLGKVGTALKGTAAAQWLLNTALFANPIGLVILGLIALGAALVVAWRKSETFRAIVTGAWTKIKEIAGGVADWFTETLFPKVSSFIEDVKGVFTGAKDWLRDNWKTALLLLLGGLPGALWVAINSKWGKEFLEKIKDAFTSLKDWVKEHVVDAIFGFFKDLPGRIGGAVGGFLNKVLPGNPAGGSGPRIPLTPGAVPGLMGASLALGPLAAIGAQHGLVVTSGLRAWDTDSKHGLGKAIDISNTYRGDPDGTPQMDRAFLSIAGAARALGIDELFYAPGLWKYGFNIDRGQAVPWTVAGHTDHIHGAVFDRGGWLPPGLTLAYNATGFPERVLDPAESAASLGRPGTPALYVEHYHANDPVDVELLAARVGQRLAVR